MGYIGRFILGYGILPTPLTKPHLWEEENFPAEYPCFITFGAELLFPLHFHPENSFCA